MPERRRDGGPHPESGEPLRRRVLAERDRIVRLSKIRELVLGFQDGLLIPLAVVTGLAGADVATSTVLVGGLAEAAAGALAMGTGAAAARELPRLSDEERDAVRARILAFLRGTLIPHAIAEEKALYPEWSKLSASPTRPRP